MRLLGSFRRVAVKKKMKKYGMSENSMRGMGHTEMLNKASMMKGMPPADKKMKRMAKKGGCK